MHGLLVQNLDLRDITGRRLDYTVAGHLAHYGHTRTWRYLSIALVALVASDPVALADHLPFVPYMLAWILGMGGYLCLQTLLMLIAAGARRALPRLPVYGPLISLLALVPTLALLAIGLELATGISVRPFFLDRLAYLLITVVMLETIFLRFVLTWDAGTRPTAGEAPMQDQAQEDVSVAAGQPMEQNETVQSETAQSDQSTQSAIEQPATQEDSAERKLLIGAQPVPISRLICLEARQHHVLARQEDGTLTQRARLSDIVAQTRREDGLQPHRSWWVAAHALRCLERRDGKPVLRLIDGSLVPVARGRVADVERWLKSHVPHPG